MVEDSSGSYYNSEEEEEEEEDEDEDEDEQEEEEQQETSEVSKTNGKEREDVCTLCWIPNALTSIEAVDAHIICREAWISHTSPKSCLSNLKSLHHAATRLVQHTDAAISLLKVQQRLLDKKVLEAQISSLQQELAHIVKQSQAESRKHALHLQTVKYEQSVYQELRECKKDLHNVEKELLEDKHNLHQDDLKRQLKEERDKSICCVCHEKPRDTIILPCLHFQYCFSCLLRHRDDNNNTCPTCRGPIQGLNMSSYLAA